MASFNKFNSFVLDLATKVHNLNSDTLKVMLTNTAPVATNTIKANITEIAAGNNYNAGGATANFVSGTQTSGTYKLILGSTAPAWTASGGNIGPFQYAVLYNSTAASGNLIGWWDYGTSLTLTNGNTFTVALDQSNGVLTLS
jgi:hypothetical protein